MSKCQYFFCTSISWFYIVTKVSGICFSDFQDNQDNQDNQDSFLCKSEARCEVVFWGRKLAGKNLRHCFIVHRCKRQPWLERSHDAIVWLEKSPATAFTVTHQPPWICSEITSYSEQVFTSSNRTLPSIERWSTSDEAINLDIWNGEMMKVQEHEFS